MCMIVKPRHTLALSQLAAINCCKLCKYYLNTTRILGKKLFLMSYYQPLVGIDAEGPRYISWSWSKKDPLRT